MVRFPRFPSKGGKRLGRFTWLIYYEAMNYNKILRDAEKRNRIFFDKLNIIGKT